jgi:hypothetical protein
MKRFLLAGTRIAFVAGLLCVGCSWAAEAGGTAGQEADASAAKSKGQAAIEAASKSGKHLFIFFFKPDHDRGKELRPLFEDTMKELAAEADAIAIDVTDPLEKELVAKYRADSVVLQVVSLSPGGYVAQAFIGIFQKENLQNAFLTPAREQCQKHFQGGRPVLLSVQSGTKEERERAMAGVKAFKADLGFGQMAEVVEFAANDPKEARFVEILEVDPKTEQTVTLLVFPALNVKARFTGATKKSALVDAILVALNSGCGCGR